ncbi:hypothetical protein CSC3H3_20320 [Thalassospira marina]|uniref:Uncharacterized protein n=1 Tax=Thalassospira marina TaxID=2048283 RepID=A0ABN5FSP4_9PROT|nr:hypothetical protein CSC3H3_20320 [Thalassospira marina]
MPARGFKVLADPFLLFQFSNPARNPACLAPIPANLVILPLAAYLCGKPTNTAGNTNRSPTATLPHHKALACQAI